MRDGNSRREASMIKDIVVHLDGTPGDETRIAYAEPIAEAFDATIIGLHVHVLPEMAPMSGPTGSQYLQDLVAADAENAGRVDASLAARFAQLGVSHELRRVDVQQGNARRLIAAETRLADLFVGLRPYGEMGEGLSIGETALFNSGRGCLFVPPGQSPPQRYGHVAVAWKDTAEAARAVAEAMPFLERAEAVSVIVVSEGRVSAEPGQEPGADIARHLGRHGVSVEIHQVAGSSDTGAAILNEVERGGAQMLVMGAYGHSRLWEWMVGGTTRHVLSEAKVPVLVAH
jgi:nucleotide-binding universal stress UspA family protein